VVAMGAHVPDVGLDAYPLGQPLPTCGCGMGRRSSARAAATSMIRISTVAPISLASAGKINMAATNSSQMANAKQTAVILG
jgi:hypothetical protein